MLVLHVLEQNIPHQRRQIHTIFHLSEESSSDKHETRSLELRWPDTTRPSLDLDLLHCRIYIHITTNTTQHNDFWCVAENLNQNWEQIFLTLKQNKRIIFFIFIKNKQWNEMVDIYWITRRELVMLRRKIYYRLNKSQLWKKLPLRII